MKDFLLANKPFKSSGLGGQRSVVLRCSCWDSGVSHPPNQNQTLRVHAGSGFRPSGRRVWEKLEENNCFLAGPGIHICKYKCRVVTKRDTWWRMLDT